MDFSELGLGEPVLKAVADAGYTTPTPIQEQAIPQILSGRDIVGCAQTGTGKTASFTLPMINILAAGRAKARMPRSLILEPTRELAAQVAESFDKYGRYHKLSKALIIGGESMADQIKILEKGVDVLIATPGRLLDVFDRGHLIMNDVRILVIDEADRMLDMGFIPDVERIIQRVSRKRQTLLFSATMPPEVRRLADAFLTDAKEISVSPPATPAETVVQRLVVVADTGGDGEREAQKAKRAALRRLIDRENNPNALIFCNRKRDVSVVHKSLIRHGYEASMLHGDMVQSARSEVLARFKRGDTGLLVCSDVAARGLDIAGVTTVFNFDVPTNAEDYVHRIGRTGRAGRAGSAFMLAVPSDGRNVAAIEKLIGRPIERLHLEGMEAAELDMSGSRRSRRKPGKAKAEPSRGRSRREAVAEAGPPSTVSAPLPPPPARETSVRDRPAEPSRDKRRRGDRRQEDDVPVVGLGDHVPAFLLREFSVPAKKERRQADETGALSDSDL